MMHVCIGPMHRLSSFGDWFGLVMPEEGRGTRARDTV